MLADMITVAIAASAVRPTFEILSISFIAYISTSKVDNRPLPSLALQGVNERFNVPTTWGILLQTIGIFKLIVKPKKGRHLHF